MGTNYYLHEKPDCPNCGRNEKPLHIGKSSMGWCFSLHIIPEEDIMTLDDWLMRFGKAGAVIKDEYGQIIKPEEMWDIILKPEENVPLRRHEIDGFCIGHGNGNYDYIKGTFL